VQWKPEFVLEHPEFNPQSPHGPDDEGSVCIAEVHDSVVVVGAPMAVTMVFGNAFEFQLRRRESVGVENFRNDFHESLCANDAAHYRMANSCGWQGCPPIVPDDVMAVSVSRSSED
jgi:hypothetical protein